MLFLLCLGVVFYIVFDLQKESQEPVLTPVVKKELPKKKQQLKPKPKEKKQSLHVKQESKKNIPKPQKRETPSPRHSCYTMQMASYKNVDTKQIQNNLAYFERKFGFSCYTKLSGIYQTIRCNIVKDRLELNPFIKTAKKYKKSFVVLKEECRFLQPVKKSTVVQKELPKNKIVKKRKQHLVISKKVTLEELEKLFDERKSYQLAIRISEIYFEKGLYKDAYKWAKTANKIDRENDKAWILLAKSKYQQGYKESAKKVLKFYLNYYYSNDVLNLLKKWEVK